MQFRLIIAFLVLLAAVAANEPDPRKDKCGLARLHDTDGSDLPLLRNGQCLQVIRHRTCVHIITDNSSGRPLHRLYPHISWMPVQLLQVSGD